MIEMKMIRYMIGNYIPSPRDPGLGVFEYYVKDDHGRIRKVEIASICPPDGYDKDIYRVRLVNSGKMLLNSLNKHGGFPIRQLYDNKEDCRNETHHFFSAWEKLREFQWEEEKNDIV